MNDDELEKMAQECRDEAFKFYSLSDAVLQYLMKVRDRQREEDARIVDPRPGPEPRDFNLHRAQVALRNHLAAAIRAGGSDDSQ